jgi:gas vesicle protein
VDIKSLIRFVNDSELGGEMLRSIGLERRRSAMADFVSGVGVFLTGALVGVGVGLLFAPASGLETRQRARSGLEEWRQKLMATGDDRKAQTGAIAEETLPGGKDHRQEPIQAS